MNLSNEAKIGLIVIAAILVSYFGFRLMRDVPLFGTTNQVQVVYDRVDGLSAGSIVYLKGVKIGSVKSLTLMPDDRILAVLSIEQGRTIPVGSIASITSPSLIDGKAIAILKSDATESVPNNGFIEGRYEEGFLEGFSDGSDDLTGDITGSLGGLNDLIASLNEVLGEQNRQAVSTSIQDLSAATATVTQVLEGKRAELEAIIDAANQTMSQLDTLTTDNREKIESILTELDASIASLQSVSTELETTLSTLNQILTKVDSGQGTLGLLVNDPALYQNLDSLSAQMEALVRGINEDPKRYLKHMRLVELF